MWLLFKSALYWRGYGKFFPLPFTVRGQLDIASGIANYGLHLARKIAVPEPVLSKANSFIQEIRANEVALPEPSEEDIAVLNYLRLAMTLQKLSNKEDMDIAEKV